MRTLAVLALVSLLNLDFSFASLPGNEWDKVDHPGVDAFYVKTRGKEYLTVIKNQSSEKMNFDTETEEEISHVLTLLRRVSLQPFGITEWKVDSLKKLKYKNKTLIQVRGTYLNKNHAAVQFLERMYFKGTMYTQFSWIQTEGQLTPSISQLESYFQNLEKEYLGN